MITVGVPWPGCRPLRCRRRARGPAVGRNSSISFEPNSRFMNEFDVICPTQPAGLRTVRAWRKPEEALHERHGQRVLALAGAIAITVRRVQRLVLDRDVGRVADDDVVPAVGQNLLQLTQVLGAVGEGSRGRCPRPRSADRCRAAASRPRRGGGCNPVRPLIAVSPLARMAATVSRKRAMATAKGLRSTPWTASRAAAPARADRGPVPRRLQRSKQPVRTRRAGSGRSRRSGRSSGSPRADARRVPGSSVRSRMNSSTNSGVCSRAYFLAPTRTGPGTGRRGSGSTARGR